MNNEVNTNEIFLTCALLTTKENTDALVRETGFCTKFRVVY